MAAPTLKEILLGGFAYFVEAGLSVDEQTVSHLIKPDMVPATNWTDHTLGTILNFKFGVTEIDAPFLRPLPTGGKTLVPRKFVTGDHVTLQTREMGEMVLRLQHGVRNKIDEGTPQTPGLQLDRKIEGWLRLQGRGLGGYDRFIQDWWAEGRLEGENVFEDTVVTPSITFTLLKVVDNVMVAGNSTNFPAQA